MEALQGIRTCRECGAKLVGRADQKFCDNMCRTSANNRRRSEEAQNKPDCIANIQKTLLNNYQILTELRKILAKYPKDLRNSSSVFGDQLFDGYTAIFTAHALTQYVANGRNTELKFKAAVDLLFT